MNLYLLAKLVELAGEIDARKRMQKIVFMLQEANCPFEAEFYLHRYGPYSSDIAQSTDELVKAGIFEEEAAGNAYKYKVTEAGKKKLQELEAKPEFKALHDRLESFHTKIQTCVSASLWELEVASTISYFFNTCKDWPDAREKGCNYKSIPSTSAFALKAEALAKNLIL